MKKAISPFKAAILLLTNNSHNGPEVQEIVALKMALNDFKIPYKQYAYPAYIQNATKITHTLLPHPHCDLNRMIPDDITKLQAGQHNILIIPGEEMQLNAYMQLSEPSKKALHSVIIDNIKAKGSLMLCGLAAKIGGLIMSDAKMKAVLSLGIDAEGWKNTRYIRGLPSEHTHTNVNVPFSSCDYQNNIYCTPCYQKESIMPHEILVSMKSTLLRITQRATTQSNKKTSLAKIEDKQK